MAARLVHTFGIWFWVAFAFFVFVLFNHSGAVLPSSYKLPAIRSSRILDINQRMARSESAWRDSVERRHQMKSDHPTPDKIPLYVSLANPSHRIFLPRSVACLHVLLNNANCPRSYLQLPCSRALRFQ